MLQQTLAYESRCSAAGVRLDAAGVSPAAPESDKENSVSVVFINSFEVPVGREDAFLELWSQIDDYMLARDGFHWRNLHKSLDDAARLRYVNVAGWESAAQFDAAHDEGFRRLQSQPGWKEFPALPALYTVVREDVAGSDG
jgi:heme-degrading monooxygenase HmoA